MAMGRITRAAEIKPFASLFFSLQASKDAEENKGFDFYLAKSLPPCFEIMI